MWYANIEAILKKKEKKGQVTLAHDLNANEKQ